MWTRFYSGSECPHILAGRLWEGLSIQLNLDIVCLIDAALDNKKICLLISHTFPSCFPFHPVQPLRLPHTQWDTLSTLGVFDLCCCVSSMAHFHKSHVSMFVARGTLTSDRSPNTECIKPLKTLGTQHRPAPRLRPSTDRGGRKISYGDAEEMFCHLKSAVERKRTFEVRLSTFTSRTAWRADVGGGIVYTHKYSGVKVHIQLGWGLRRRSSFPWKQPLRWSFLCCCPEGEVDVCVCVFSHGAVLKSASDAIYCLLTPPPPPPPHTLTYIHTVFTKHFLSSVRGHKVNWSCNPALWRLFLVLPHSGSVCFVIKFPALF